LHLKAIRIAKMQPFKETVMTTISNVSAVAKRALCFALAAIIVSAALTIGAVGADAEFNSAQRAQVIVEFA
jgi:hypothetical protein